MAQRTDVRVLPALGLATPWENLLWQPRPSQSSQAELFAHRVDRDGFEIQQEWHSASQRDIQIHPVSSTRLDKFSPSPFIVSVPVRIVWYRNYPFQLHPVLADQVLHAWHDTKLYPPLLLGKSFLSSKLVVQMAGRFVYHFLSGVHVFDSYTVASG